MGIILEDVRDTLHTTFSHYTTSFTQYNTILYSTVKTFVSWTLVDCWVVSEADDTCSVQFNAEKKGKKKTKTTKHLAVTDFQWPCWDLWQLYCNLQNRKLSDVTFIFSFTTCFFYSWTVKYNRTTSIVVLRACGLFPLFCLSYNDTPELVQSTLSDSAARSATQWLPLLAAIDVRCHNN